VRDEGSLHVAVVPVFTAIGTVLDEPIDCLGESLRPLLLFLPSKCQKLLVTNVVPTLLFRQFTMPCAFEEDFFGLVVLARVVYYFRPPDTS
jgi:hypothetical protein